MQLCIHGIDSPLPPPHPPAEGSCGSKTSKQVPSGENTEFKRSPFKAWSRSVYSNTCYAYCQRFLPRLFLPFLSIRLHFFQILSQFFFPLCWLWLTPGSCIGPQNKIGNPAGCSSRVERPRNINSLKNNNNMTCGMMTCEMNNLEIG